jgi:hypothetical protein
MYLTALQPPPGYTLDGAVATTFSLDLAQLLGFPVALALGTFDPRKLGAESSVALLEAIRRTADRLVVFADGTHVHVPREKHVLYGLLDASVVPVLAPRGGAFHPKLWALRFREEGGESSRLRLLVLSRNLSPDRCWDVALSLDGTVTARNRIANTRLAALFSALPDMAINPVPDELRARIDAMAADLRRTEFELPDGFEELAFHVLGRDGKPWVPAPSRRLVVVSPFLSDSTVRALGNTTDEAVAFVSRAEEFDKATPSALAQFKRLLMLHESAETEDGEDTTGTGLRGLHAKVYLAQRGWDTHLYLGSANATHAALGTGVNIEVLAELRGKTSRVPGKGIDGFLDAKDGMGRLLVDYVAPSEKPTVDAVDEAAEQALDAAARVLAAARIRLGYAPSATGYTPTLTSPRAIELPGVASVHAWLVTVDAIQRTEVSAVTEGHPVALPSCAAASATTLVAWELRASTCARTRSFVLSLAVDGFPADRDAHVMRLVIDNRGRFLAYVQALLAGIEEGSFHDRLEVSGEGARWEVGAGGFGPGLLEQLVRAKSRAPERIVEIRRVVEALSSTPEGHELLPREFIEVWSMIAEAP